MQKNNLIALLDSCFPNINTLFTSPRRESDGHEKWIDFVMKFPHIHSVSKLSLSAFKIKYQSWCKKNNYNYSESKAAEIHAYSRTQVSVLPMTDSVIKIITEAAALLIPRKIFSILRSKKRCERSHILLTTINARPQNSYNGGPGAARIAQ